MTGLPDLNRTAFAEAQEKLRGCASLQNPETVNPHEKGLGDDAPWEAHLKMDIKLLMDCDGIAMLPGWEKSRGAKLEHGLAVQLGIEVRLLEEWLGAPRAAPAKEAVDHPQHYGGADNPYEVIKVCRAWLSPTEMIGALKFQVIKYTPRAGNKDGQLASQDIAKAAWYANYLAGFLKEKGL